ncbi:hypothetical protein [Rhodovibrio sodomensis]|uniref:hypothetical protein n=1 Tax=Rhodovibrio sodomensis TaxID=1088 RepID=UPI0019055085|nr:hypothetical protein [Rhodovibrio sodomensis]
MKRISLTDEDHNPRRIFNRRVEWPLALLFAAVPLLAIVAVVKNVLLAGGGA